MPCHRIFSPSGRQHDHHNAGWRHRPISISPHHISAGHCRLSDRITPIILDVSSHNRMWSGSLLSRLDLCRLLRRLSRLALSDGRSPMCVLFQPRHLDIHVDPTSNHFSIAEHPASERHNSALRVRGAPTVSEQLQCGRSDLSLLPHVPLSSQRYHSTTKLRVSWRGCG